MITLNSHFFCLGCVGGYTKFSMGFSHNILLSRPVCEEERWKRAVALHKGCLENKQTKNKNKRNPKKIVIFRQIMSGECGFHNTLNLVPWDFFSLLEMFLNENLNFRDITSCRH